MIRAQISGVVAVMLTPFDVKGRVDYAGLESLTEWYLAHDVGALFAVCQSSEMQALSISERAGIARFVTEQTDGRVPVIASGHVSTSIAEQTKELAVIADTGVNGIVLVTNRLDVESSGIEEFRQNLFHLLDALPSDLPLGLYECPAPFRRLLTDDELGLCLDTGRFNVLKDVSCDLDTVIRRINLVGDSGFHIINANAAIAFDAMKAGAPGFSGVFTNFHPDLYAWLYRNQDVIDPFVQELVNFLALSACAESFGYPGIAKLYHQRLGTIKCVKSRVIDYELEQRHWAIGNIVNHIHEGTLRFREGIKSRSTLNGVAK